MLILFIPLKFFLNKQETKITVDILLFLNTYKNT